MRCRLFLAVFLISSQAAYALDTVPVTEYRQRRVRLAAKLHGGSAVIFAAHEPPMEYQDYRQDEDFFYLTGSPQPGGALLIIGDGPATSNRLGPIPAHAYREILFLPMRNLVREKYTGKKTDAATPGAREALGVDEVMPLASLPEVFGSFLAEDTRRAKEVWTQQDLDTASAALVFTSTVLGTDVQPPGHDVRELTQQM